MQVDQNTEQILRQELTCTNSHMASIYTQLADLQAAVGNNNGQLVIIYRQMGELQGHLNRLQAWVNTGQMPIVAPNQYGNQPQSPQVPQAPGKFNQPVPQDKGMAGTTRETESADDALKRLQELEDQSEGEETQEKQN